MRTATLAAVILATGCGSSPEVAPPPAPASGSADAATAARASIVASEQFYDIDGSSAGALRNQISRLGPQDDRRAQRPRGDGRAHAAPWGELRQTLGRGHARGGAGRGGRPRAQPRIRYPDEPRADAGGGAGAVNGRDRPGESSMPVTAKLSLTNELVEWGNDRRESFRVRWTTYRGELRELNEVNYARFEATLDRRITALGSELRQEIAELRVGMASLEGGLLARMGMAEGRLARLTLLLWIGTLGALIALL